MESDDTRKFDEFDDLLSRYLKGQLLEEEEAEFHRLISDDAELRNKAVGTARLARAMAQVGPECDRAIIDAIKTLTLDQAEDLADNNSEQFWLSPPGVYRACCLPENYREERKKIREKLRKKHRKNRKKHKPLTFGKFMGLRQLQPLLRYAFGVDIEPSYMNLRTFRRPFRLRFLLCSPSLSTSAARATV